MKKIHPVNFDILFFFLFTTSKDYGDNWQQINTGLTITNIRSLAFDSEDYLYAGTNCKSIFKTTTLTVTSVESEKDLPTTYYLDQNYPNPFNPSTKISYQIPASLNPSQGGTLVTLKVYDIRGNEVATLVNEEKPAGRYGVDCRVAHESIRAIASGVYFYQLQYGEYISTLEMMLIK